MPRRPLDYWDPTQAVANSAGLPFGENPQGTWKVLPEPDEYLRGRWDDRNWRNVPHRSPLC